MAEMGTGGAGSNGTAGGPDKHGRLYWFRVNLGKRLRAFASRHKVAFTLGLLVLILASLGLRAVWHPLVMVLRQQIHIPLLLLVFVLVGWPLGKLSSRRPLYLWSGLGLLLVGGLVAALFTEADPHLYLAQYLRYRSLQVEPVEKLPVSDHERIQPHNSVFTLAKEAMTDSETPTDPDLVKVGSEYRWTMGIEPAYPGPQFFDNVREIFSLSAVAPSPSFSHQNRLEVSFETGEHLRLGKNARANAIKTFGLWRFLHYEPADVKYVVDDAGQWVQLVSLIRWRGWLFPRPEFGGVLVVEQDRAGGVVRDLQRTLLGVGRWIPPARVAQHGYLRGQNVVPYAVSRYEAQSFKFQNGFLAPMPGYHRGDIRIPDLPRDVNDQPFVAYFRFTDREGADKLYHYFALEPFDPEKQGLNTSLFVPADGIGPTLVHKHFERREALTGVSAIAAKVIESRKEYDWTRSKPVEHRPFLKDIGGKRRFFWLTTVVTRKEGGSDFIAGSVPDVVLTDAEYKVVTWVDPLKPEGWVEHLEGELGSVWE